MSPTARTLGWLRENAIEAQVVERRIPHGHTTIDLFGCIDIVALDGSILGIQTTTGDHHANRVAKALEEKRLVGWMKCGGRFEVWSWTKSARWKVWERRISVARLDGDRLVFRLKQA